MDYENTYRPENLHYLKMLARQYPSVQAASTEIINLQAILNLPKGTEHFISDVHGEHEAFLHILNSGSGDEVKKLVWQDKVFDVNVEKASTIRFSTDGKKVYILANVDGEKDTGDLYEAKFSKSGMGKAKEIDTDVSTYGWGFSKDVGVYYLKDYKTDTNKGDLYVKGKKIDFDVSSGGVAAFKGGYLYESGDDMKYYKSGKTITVAEKVRSVALINSDTLILLYDWNSEKGKGTLGVFTGGKKVTELDEDVTRLIAPNYSLIRSIY